MGWQNSYKHDSVFDLCQLSRLLTPGRYEKKCLKFISSSISPNKRPKTQKCTAWFSQHGCLFSGPIWNYLFKMTFRLK